MEDTDKGDLWNARGLAGWLLLIVAISLAAWALTLPQLAFRFAE